MGKSEIGLPDSELAVTRFVDADNEAFINKDGSLTPYALECGFKQIHIEGELSLILWKEGDRYEVQLRSPWHTKSVGFWRTYKKLGAARTRFRIAVERDIPVALAIMALDLD